MAVRMKAWSAILPALIAVAAVIAGPNPAQAASTASTASHAQVRPAGVQEVARKHPSDVTGTFVDDHMTLVKYYNGSQYQFCVANYHHSGEVSDFSAWVDWTNGPTDLIGLPAPGGLGCSPWRALHGRLHVQYEFAGLLFIDSI